MADHAMNIDFEESNAAGMQAHAINTIILLFYVIRLCGA